MLLMAIAPFLFVGWYMVVGLVMAFIIKSSIPDTLNNDDRRIATVCWCVLTSALLALGGDTPFLIGWIASLTGMLVVAWPAPAPEKRRRRRRHRNQDEHGNIYSGNHIVITDAEVIDVEAKVIDV